MKKINGLIIGFILGVAMMIGCGSNGQLASINASIAAAIGNAVDVIFDNGSSKLTATNVQTAIEELNTKIKMLESKTLVDDELADSLVGNWAGTYCNGNDCNNVSLALTADGKMSCAVPAGQFGFLSGACNDIPGTWEVIKNVLKINYNHPDINNTGRFFTIFYSDSQNLIMSEGVNHLYNLTK